MVVCYVWDVEVAGSSPVYPTLEGVFLSFIILLITDIIHTVREDRVNLHAEMLKLVDKTDLKSVDH